MPSNGQDRSLNSPAQQHLVEEEIDLDKLLSGDHPSLFAVGVIVSKALKDLGTAVLMTDVLGRVHLLPKTWVEVKKRPRLTDDELSVFSEEESVAILSKQGCTDDEIVAYLKRRDSKGGP